MEISKPVIFKSREEAPADAIVVDAFSSALEELFFVQNPNLKKVMPEAQDPLQIFLKNNTEQGVWIYYPWRNTVVHSLPEDIYFRLRTARNRNIIRDEEQKKYRQTTVGVAGLSVGSAAIYALAVSGGPKHLKIADFDVLEVTNLNRIRGTLLDIGKNKTEVSARLIWELDPFAELHLWDMGVTRGTLEDFIIGEPRLDIFIDEMDSLDLKVLSRFVCKRHKVPALMATDNGDGIILDVERFDQEPDRPIFHGLVGDMKAEDLKDLDFKKWLELATKIVGPTYLTERMQESLVDMGKRISAVPQLGTTAAVAGSAIAYAVRRIANKQDFPSGRYTFGFEEKLIPHYMEPDQVNIRQEKTRQFIDAFGRKK